MKRILSYIILAWVAFSACSKDDDPVFPDSADERIRKTLAAYQSALEGSPNGWNGVLTTKNGVIYHFHFSFNSANRVQMFSDIDKSTGSTRKESSYRLKALQQPVLIFDTYSYIHYLADPADSVAGGVDGQGLGSDFEFRLDTLMTDSIRLTGRFQQAKLVLKKASANDAAAWQNGVWAKNLAITNIRKDILHYFKRLTVGSRSYDLTIDPVYRHVNFTWRDANGAEQSHASDFYFTTDGMVLIDALQDGSSTISRLSDFVFTSNTFSYALKVNGTASATIAGVNAPIVPDVDAPVRWINAVGSTGYWSSYRAVHVNGVDDAYGLGRLPNYMFLYFQPVYDDNGNFQYCAAGPVFLENGGLTLPYFAALGVRGLTANGRIIFQELGEAGTVPASHRPAFDGNIDWMAQSSGFFLVQTGADTYDMVSAADSRVWFSWE